MNWRIWYAGLWGYWIMFAVGLMLGIFDFKWEATFGEIALGIIAAIVTGSIGIFRFWLPRHPFTLRFYEKPGKTPDQENPSTDWKILCCAKGQPQTLLIGVQLRTQRTFKTVDIRPVERRWPFFWIWRESSGRPVRITAIKDQQFVWAGRDKDDNNGGREATYEDVVDFPRGGVMWYEIIVSAEQDWNGWLGFQLRRGSSHKGIARAKLCFKLTS